MLLSLKYILIVCYVSKEFKQIFSLFFSLISPQIFENFSNQTESYSLNRISCAGHQQFQSLSKLFQVPVEELIQDIGKYRLTLHGRKCIPRRNLFERGSYFRKTNDEQNSEKITKKREVQICSSVALPLIIRLADFNKCFITSFSMCFCP